MSKTLAHIEVPYIMSICFPEENDLGGKNYHWWLKIICETLF
jgi:hypothetical protein